MENPIRSKQGVAEWMQSLAEPTRLAIICVLSNGPLHVSEISEAVNAEVVNVSHHLGRMKLSGILACEKKGRFMFYQLKDATVSKNKNIRLRHESGTAIIVPLI